MENIMSNDDIKNKDLKELSLPEGRQTIEREEFKGYSCLEKVTIPDSINWIRRRAFENCKSLKEISFSGNAHWVEIELGAFKGCKALKSIALPYGVTAIHEDTFKDCSSLEEIIIPDSVVFIGENAFKNCSSLRKISLPWIMEKLDRTILSGSCPFEEITYTRNPDYHLEGNFLVSKDGHELKKFYYNTDQEVVIPENITKIADFALRYYYFDHDPYSYELRPQSHPTHPSINNKKFTKLIIPETVKEFSEDAFTYMDADFDIQIDERLVKDKFSFFAIN